MKEELHKGRPQDRLRVQVRRPLVTCPGTALPSIGALKHNSRVWGMQPVAIFQSDLEMPMSPPQLGYSCGVRLPRYTDALSVCEWRNRVTWTLPGLRRRLNRCVSCFLHVACRLLLQAQDGAAEVPALCAPCAHLCTASSCAGARAGQGGEGPGAAQRRPQDQAGGRRGLRNGTRQQTHQDWTDVAVAHVCGLWAVWGGLGPGGSGEPLPVERAARRGAAQRGGHGSRTAGSQHMPPRRTNPSCCVARRVLRIERSSTRAGLSL